MPWDRREFLQVAIGGAVAAALVPPGETAPTPRFRAVAFDAFPVFDPRPVVALAGNLFPGRGMELASAWRTRQFEYQWLRAVAGQYADFRKATEDALVFACRQLGLELTAEHRTRLTDAYAHLPAWPDVPDALRRLKGAGVRLGFLSNMTREMLEANVASAGLDGAFEKILSTDVIRSYKPDPRAYHLAIDAFGLRREEILFAAFAGWDAAGAKAFGYPTYWVNRLGAPAEELGFAADAVGRNLTELAGFVLEGAPR